MVKPNQALLSNLEEILKDRDTKEWVETIASESARINYPKHVAEYLLYRKIKIKRLITNFNKDQIKETKKVQEFVNFMLKKLAASTVANYASAIKSRIKYDGIQLTRDIRIPNRHLHPTIATEVVPTKEQIISFLRNAKPSSQVIIALIAFLGVRFNVIGDLRISDFPEMSISDKKIIFEKMPTRVKIRAVLSKNKKEYQTFLIEFGCMILKNWLELRLREDEQLDSDSLIVPTVHVENASLRRRANIVARRLYTVFNKINYTSRPYSIKDFFATALLNSGIEQNYQTFFMGHTGPMQNEYSVRRQQPAEQIEIMRKLFKEKIEPHLVPQENHSQVAVKDAFRKFAKEMGLEVKDEASTDETIEEIAKIYGAAKENLSRRGKTQKTRQKRISEKELDSYLDKGWELHNVLPSGDLVIKNHH